MLSSKYDGVFEISNNILDKIKTNLLNELFNEKEEYLTLSKNNSNRNNNIMPSTSNNNTFYIKNFSSFNKLKKNYNNILSRVNIKELKKEIDNEIKSEENKLKKSLSNLSNNLNTSNSNNSTNNKNSESLLGNKRKLVLINENSSNSKNLTFYNEENNSSLENRNVDKASNNEKSMKSSCFSNKKKSNSNEINKEVSYIVVHLKCHYLEFFFVKNLCLIIVFFIV